MSLEVFTAIAKEVVFYDIQLNNDLLKHAARRKRRLPTLLSLMTANGLTLYMAMYPVSRLWQA